MYTSISTHPHKCTMLFLDSFLLVVREDEMKISTGQNPLLLSRFCLDPCVGPYEVRSGSRGDRRAGG
jgi:hypothetical protein